MRDEVGRNWKRTLGLIAVGLCACAKPARAQSAPRGRPDIVAKFSKGEATVVADGDLAHPAISSGTISISTDDATCVPSATVACWYTINSFQFALQDFQIKGENISGLTLWNWYSVGNLRDTGFGVLIPKETPFATSFTAANGTSTLLESPRSALLVQIDAQSDRVVVTGEFTGTVSGITLDITLDITADTPLANHPPIADAGPDQTLTSDCFASVKLDGSGTRDVDGDLAFSYFTENNRSVGDSSAVPLPIGIHDLTLLAADSHGGRDTDHVSITVNDSGAVPRDSGAKPVSIRTPIGVVPSQLALLAGDRLEVGSRASILEESGLGAAIASLGDDATAIKERAHVGEVWSSDRVLLGPRAVIDGAIHTSANVSGAGHATLGGPLDIGAILTPPRVTSWNVFYPNECGRGFSRGCREHALPPGAYDKIEVEEHRALSLSSGTYYVDDLLVEHDATLKLDESQGPIVIYVRRSLRSDGQVLTADHASAAGTLFVALGTSPLAIRGKFAGTVLAPDAEIKLGPSADLAGAFFGWVVDVQPNSKLVHQSFDWSLLQPSRSACIVTPVAECIEHGAGSAYTVHFGYRDALANYGASVPLGPFNHVTGGTEAGQPSEFLPGTHHDVFHVDSSGAEVLWVLGNRSARASRMLQGCR